MKKRIILIGMCWLVASLIPLASRGQSVAQCIEQLALDYQKLAGLKSILSQMYSGYEVVTKGYNGITGVAKGNFSLHEAFIDGLWLVSPTVRKYPKVSAVISDQATLVSEYHAAWRSAQQNKGFSPDELSYMLEVYNNLVTQSLDNLSALSLVMSDSKLRMSDAERLRSIDRIYAKSHEQLSFLRKFNNQVSHTGAERSQATADAQTQKNLYGIK